MSLLKSAVKARIPLIAARTDDPANFREVVAEIIGHHDVRVARAVAQPMSGKYAMGGISATLNPGQVAVTEYHEWDWKGTEKWLSDNDVVLIVINPPELHPLMLDVGFVSVPVQLIADFVRASTNAVNINDYVAALSGLSLQNIDRISKLAQAEYHEFTPKSLRAIRKQFFQTVRGIEEVATEQMFYDASPELKEWLQFEGKLFRMGTHPVLTPRGFLFKGSPGTGKTSGAKYLAHELKVPLYRLDLGQVLNKWAGESDSRLNAALKQAESFQPCVLLIDEVEKLFEASNGSDIVTRLLSQLLWWLQEHTSKVLVVMTTNHEDKIPPELYRERRLDKVVEFTGLTNANLLSFMRELATRLSHIAVVPTEDLEALAWKMYPGGTILNGPTTLPSQSRATEQVLRLVKLKIVQQMKGESSVVS